MPRGGEKRGGLATVYFPSNFVPSVSLWCKTVCIESVHGDSNLAPIFLEYLKKSAK
jgi:hypothetical protein